MHYQFVANIPTPSPFSLTTVCAIMATGGKERSNPDTSTPSNNGTHKASHAGFFRSWYILATSILISAIKAGGDKEPDGTGAASKYRIRRRLDTSPLQRGNVSLHGNRGMHLLGSVLRARVVSSSPSLGHSDRNHPPPFQKDWDRPHQKVARGTQGQQYSPLSWNLPLATLSLQLSLYSTQEG